MRRSGKTACHPPRHGAGCGPVPVAWRIEEAARQFGAGLVGLMQLADELNGVQRQYLMWALANSLERLLRSGALQPVASGHRHAPRLADFIRRRAVVAPWPGRGRGRMAGRRRVAARRTGGGDEVNDPMADPRVRMFPIHRREDRCAVCGQRVTVSHYDKDLRGPVGVCCLALVLLAQDALNLHVVPPDWQP